MKNNPYTDHHLIAQSYGGSRDPQNLKRLRENYHRAFHQVFDNDTPVMQMRRIVNLNSTCLTTEFKANILSILQDYGGHDELYAYNNGVLVPREFLEAQERFSSGK